MHNAQTGIRRCGSIRGRWRRHLYHVTDNNYSQDVKTVSFVYMVMDTVTHCPAALRIRTCVRAGRSPVRPCQSPGQCPGHRVHGHPLRRCLCRRRHKIRIQLMATKRCRKRCTKAAPEKLHQTKEKHANVRTKQTGKLANVAALFFSPSTAAPNVIASNCKAVFVNLHQCVQRERLWGVTHTLKMLMSTHTHTRC